MSNRRAIVSKADITRLIKAALEAGVGVERISGVKITRDSAVLLFGEQKADHTKSLNEWDEVLSE